MALRVLWAASGEDAVVFHDEELQALVEERGNTIKALKLELMSRGFGSRFRLRLLQAEEHLEVGDDVVIVPPLVLKMVKLAFLLPDQEGDEEVLDACQEGDLQEVEEVASTLQTLQHWRTMQLCMWHLEEVDTRWCADPSCNRLQRLVQLLCTGLHQMPNAKEWHQHVGTWCADRC
ncbi:unnamed protein product [Durusdinium trenchii]|uniref:Ubiquitin-like domain-containing protein n=2 Tax=Durusdinium trenchii TaxID=1381693 RepID=A0ABP0NLR1_9DINO